MYVIPFCRFQFHADLIGLRTGRLIRESNRMPQTLSSNLTEARVFPFICPRIIGDIPGGIDFDSLHSEFKFCLVLLAFLGQKTEPSALTIVELQSQMEPFSCTISIGSLRLNGKLEA